MEVIFVDTSRGSGTAADPVRGVAQYWSKEGVLLAEYDTIFEAPDMAGPAEAEQRERQLHDLATLERIDLTTIADVAKRDAAIPASRAPAMSDAAVAYGWAVQAASQTAQGGNWDPTVAPLSPTESALAVIDAATAVLDRINAGALRSSSL